MIADGMMEFPNVCVLHGFECCIRRIRYRLSGDSDFFVAALQWNLAGAGHSRKKSTLLGLQGAFCFSVRTVVFRTLDARPSSGLERKDYVATESGLASCEVFVEAVAIFVPNPANFWTEQQVCVSSVVHTGRVVVQIIILYIAEA